MVNICQTVDFETAMETTGEVTMTAWDELIAGDSQLKLANLNFKSKE